MIFAIMKLSIAVKSRSEESKMQTDQISMIHNLIQLIEENIHENLDLDALAEETGFSKYYIDRLFTALTGQRLMNYVRGRRLTRSLDDLVNTRLNIIDIAQEYQFSYEQTYIRAFKQQFQMTPAQYRRTHCEMPGVQVADTSGLYSAGDGLLTAPRMCMLPRFHLQGIEREIQHGHNYFHQDTNQLVEIWEKDYLPHIKNKANPFVYMGLVRYTDDPYGRMYAACTEVAEPVSTVSHVKNYTIPAYNYASFRYVGMHSPYEITFKTLQELYHKINIWKEKTSYMQADGFHFERVDLKKCDTDYCEMDIYVPVCSRSRENRK